MKYYLTPVTLFLMSIALVPAKAQSVDPLTGQLQFSVPLGQLSAIDISVPVEAVYHGNALSVEDVESSCGLNWSLKFGGAVTRYVRGLPDELNETGRKGWLYNGNAQSIQNFAPNANDLLANDCADEVPDWNFLEGKGYAQDTEPDLYSFHAPGLSGQFVLDASGTPRLLVHNDLLITVNVGTITITTNTGTKYTFASTETIFRRSEPKVASINRNSNFHYYQNATYFISRWHLTSVQSLATGAVASFQYSPLDEVISRSYQTQILSSTSTQLDTLYEMKDTYTPLRISAATLKSSSVSFTWENNLVKLITFADAGSVEKRQVVFDYFSIKGAPPLMAKPEIHRPFLKSIRTVNDCAPFASYEFDYAQVVPSVDIYVPAQVPVPWRSKSGQDWFGYFNGQVGNNNIPHAYLYANETDAKRLRVAPLTGNTPTQTITGQDRSVSATHNTFGALTRVTLPEGGSTNIEYEPNTYYDPSTGETYLAGGVRVKRIKTNPSEVALGKKITDFSAYRDLIKEYEYQVADGAGQLTSGRLVSAIHLAYLTAQGVVRSQQSVGDHADVLYARVKEKTPGQGGRIYEFSLPGTFPEIVNGDWSATKSRIARKPQTPCIAEGYVKNAYYAFPFPSSKNYNHKRGFLSRVAELSETGALVRETVYTPLELSANPQIIKGLRFEKIDDVYYYGVYEIQTGKVQVVAQEISREWRDSPTSQMLQTTKTSAYNANNMLRSVTVSHPNGSISVEKFKYAKDFIFTNPATTDTAAVALKKLNDLFRHGQLIERVSTLAMPGAAPTVTGAQLTLFWHVGTNHVLPHYVKQQLPGAQHTEAYVVAATQRLGIDSTYRTVQKFHEYDNNRMVLVASDDKRNVVSYHYDTSTPVLVANISRARAIVLVWRCLRQPPTLPAGRASGLCLRPPLCPRPPNCRKAKIPTEFRVG
jgi:hypothetical protein